MYDAMDIKRPLYRGRRKPLKKAFPGKLYNISPRAALTQRGEPSSVYGIAVLG